jgi:hypothetical protein
MNKDSVEMNLRIAEGGELLIPKSALHRLNVGRGSQVHVRLTPAVLTGKLKARRVTEEEIQTIAALQLEPRENVVRFLATQSAFSRNKLFLRRVREAGRKR